MRCFRADLHIHTGLSPCAAEEMTPPAIVRTALERGLAMIAICDHNSARNAAATQTAALRAAARTPPGESSTLAVIAGLEITTAEEVHIVGLFPDSAAACAAAEEVGATLPKADFAYYHRFGLQREMDADGQVIGMEERMLAMASTLELTDAVALVHRHGGLAIAAHVNRPSFSALSQLGMFPANAGFDAVEVFTPCGAGDECAIAGRAATEHAALGLPLLASSDAHFLGDIGRCQTQCEVEAPVFDELAQAIRGVGGRGVGLV